MKTIYPPHQMITVRRYANVGDYDREWDAKFSTVTEGKTIVVKPKGYKRSIGQQHVRNVPIADVQRFANDLEDIKRQPIVVAGGFLKRSRKWKRKSQMAKKTRRRKRRTKNLRGESWEAAGGI